MWVLADGWLGFFRQASADGAAFYAGFFHLAVYALSFAFLFWMTRWSFRGRGDVADFFPVFAVAGVGGLILKTFYFIGLAGMMTNGMSSGRLLSGLVVLINIVPWCDILLGVLVFAALRCLVPKVDWRKIRRIPVVRGYRFMGCVLVLLLIWEVGIRGLTVGLVASCDGIDSTHEGVICLAELFFALTFQVIPACLILGLARRYFRYARICREIGRTLDGLGTHKAPVLFLRSFKLDVVVGGKSFDEYVCGKVADGDTPIISLCDPDEDIPSGGSIKIQAKDSHWKELIAELIPKCRAVVMYEGVTNGLQWEIGSVRASVAPERFFVVSPPARYRVAAWFGCPSKMIWVHRLFSRGGIRAAYAFIWSRFRATMVNSGILLQEDPMPDESVIAFTSDWRSLPAVRCNRKAGVIGKVLELTDDRSGDCCDYSKIMEEIGEFVRRQEVPEEVRMAVGRMKRFLLWFTGGLMAVITLAIYIISCMVLGLRPTPEMLMMQNTAKLEGFLQAFEFEFRNEQGDGVSVYSFSTNVTDFMFVALEMAVRPETVTHTGSIFVTDKLKDRLPSFANEYNRRIASARDGYVFVNTNCQVSIERSLSALDFRACDKESWVVDTPIQSLRALAVGLGCLLDPSCTIEDAVSAVEAAVAGDELR